MSTKGDQILDKPLPQIGGKSLFTRELEDALEEKRVDFAVHSLKDLPTTLPPGLAIGAILQREDPRDALILHEKHSGSTLDSLPEGSIIGTSSLRRCSQLRRKYPRLVVKDIRGNLQTRLKKLEQGIFDGIILAVAGVQRMGWQSKISQILDEREMLYAVGQGALAVECRREDCRVFCHLSHIPTVLRVVAERSLLCRLEAGCSAPIAVTTVLRETLKRKELELTAAVWSLDGSQVIKEIMVATLPPLGHKERDQPEKLW
ncbi:hypothetical protein AAG570_001182 [Ranatra chinensis]|uniref:hydroxymethylbilane synthase n=1 Tax=Ranatra chinensis TaxID=642074 RepID=A0ABD0YTQ4_9HEMI